MDWLEGKERQRDGGEKKKICKTARSCIMLGEAG